MARTLKSRAKAQIIMARTLKSKAKAQIIMGRTLKSRAKAQLIMAQYTTKVSDTLEKLGCECELKEV